ncbi:hypothetical protein Q9233_000576 [Columba guinea]|nr:hypothetical protein Q9233_000576 [Columba guinea]
MEHSFMLFSQLSAPSAMTGSAAFQLLTSHYRPSWEHAALWLETNVWALITIWRENEIQGQLNLALTTNIVFLAIEAFSLPMCTIVAVFPGFASEINATELSKNNSMKFTDWRMTSLQAFTISIAPYEYYVAFIVELECVITDNTADDRGPCFESLRHFCDMPYTYTSNSHVGTLQEGMGCAQRGEGRQMKKGIVKGLYVACFALPLLDGYSGVYGESGFMQQSPRNGAMYLIEEKID